MSKATSTERVRRFREKTKEQGWRYVDVKVPIGAEKAVKAFAAGQGTPNNPKPERSQAAIKKAAYRASRKSQGYKRIDLHVKSEHVDLVRAYVHQLEHGSAIQGRKDSSLNAKTFLASPNH